MMSSVVLYREGSQEIRRESEANSAEAIGRGTSAENKEYQQELSK